MPEHFKFKPFQAKVKNVPKTYICRYCGANKLALAECTCKKNKKK